MKTFILMITLALALAACSKADKEATQQVQLKQQADKARMELQEKADALARNPPPELIKAAKEQAAAQAAKAGGK
jgi:hypothetical protein